MGKSGAQMNDKNMEHEDNWKSKLEKLKGKWKFLAQSF